MKKKLLVLVMICLTFFIVGSINAGAAESGSCGDNLTWTLDDEGTLIISGTGEMIDYSWETSPFCDNRNIKNIVINEGVTKISNSAFIGCSQLTDVEIPTSVTHIGSQAFRSCSRLRSVRLPKNVTYIDEYAFYQCDMLKKINIPSKVTYIGEGAFRGCSSLKTINIPKGIDTLYYFVFLDCSSLESILIPDSITDIRNSAFYNCNSLKNIYYMGDSAKWNSINIGEDNELFANATVHYNYKIISSGNCGKDGDNVTWNFDEDTGTLTISGKGKMDVFYNESSVPWNDYGEEIYHINIENGVCSIGGYNTFHACINLESITIPYTVIQINGAMSGMPENYTIRGYTNSYAEKIARRGNILFESIGVMPKEPLDSGECGENLTWTLDTYGDFSVSGTGAMYDYDIGWENKVLPPWYDYSAYIKSVNIGDGVTHIGDYSFYYSNTSERITSLQLPTSLKSIGDYAFSFNCNLEVITFPEGLESIGTEAFRLCGIKEVSFPDTMREIKSYAFYLNNFKTIDLGNGIQTIGKYAFSSQYSLDGEECKLERITIPNSLINMDAAFCWQYDLQNVYIDEQNGNFKSVDGVIYSKDGKKLIFCPVGLEKEGRVNVCKGTKMICERAFDGCTKITEIIIPEGVTTLKYGFASGCDSLYCLYIPSTVTEIEACTFFSSLGYYGRDISDIYYSGSEEEWNALIEKDTGFPKMYGDKTSFHYNAIGTNPPIITATNLISNNLGASVSVGLSNTEYDSTLITAFYKDGVLIDLETTLISAGDTNEEISIPDNIDADEVKSFIWNSVDSMKPLCEAKSINL